jgi:hypothetical protein
MFEFSNEGEIRFVSEELCDTIHLRPVPHLGES